jgi:AraC family transcriptional regulator of adaptative response/methylated-DNA-[protein]-cysteine methyltransferase
MPSSDNSAKHRENIMPSTSAIANDKIICCDLSSPLGEMIAGTSEKGICFLEWHDRGGADRIKARVEKRYRRSIETGENQHLAQLRDELAQYFDGKLSQFRVDLDIRGTEFEQMVWRQLLKIPYGETRSYGQMAVDLHRPGAQRAVGRANGANYIAVVIPCHRVIEANGKLRGYGGGLWRKEWLLKLEQSQRTLAL